MYADELLLPWLRDLIDRLPGVRLFDAHTHLGGNDPEGWQCVPGELLEALALVDGRAAVFPLMEPDGYRAANDAVVAAADASEGRLVPFCRVDPGTEPVRELERCLAAGARGVKLHPRAERFDLRHAGVAEVFAVAAERRLPVTIHSGLGIPSLGRDALALAERFPQAPLILAHVGVTDLAWIWRHLDGHPSVFFDSAWWNPADHLALFALVPPGRILLGSDCPLWHAGGSGDRRDPLRAPGRADSGTGRVGRGRTVRAPRRGPGAARSRAGAGAAAGPGAAGGARFHAAGGGAGEDARGPGGRGARAAREARL